MADQVLIGRKEEQEILQRCVDSEKAEFVAVFGHHMDDKQTAWRQRWSS